MGRLSAGHTPGHAARLRCPPSIPTNAGRRPHAAPRLAGAIGVFGWIGLEGARGRAAGAQRACRAAA